MFGKLPSDPFFEEINIYEKLWLYEGWVNKMDEDAKLKKSMAILTGGFHNPEMARKMLSLETPDHVTTEEEFEQSWQEVEKAREQEESKALNKRRRRRKLKNLRKQKQDKSS